MEGLAVYFGATLEATPAAATANYYARLAQSSMASPP